MVSHVRINDDTGQWVYIRNAAMLCCCQTPLCISMVSCQKGPTHHAYARQIEPFWQDTIDTW